MVRPTFRRDHGNCPKHFVAMWLWLCIPRCLRALSKHKYPEQSAQARCSPNLHTYTAGFTGIGVGVVAVVAGVAGSSGSGSSASRGRRRRRRNPQCRTCHTLSGQIFSCEPHLVRTCMKGGGVGGELYDQESKPHVNNNLKPRPQIR